MPRTIRKYPKRKTRRRHKEKRVWLFKRGNITFAYKVPKMTILPAIQHGGAGSTEEKLRPLLFDQLPAGGKDQVIIKYLNSQKSSPKLITDFMNSGSNPAIAPVLEELKKPEPSVLDGSKLNDAGKALFDWVKKRMIASEVLDTLKEKIKSDPSKYTAKDLEAIEKTLNSENICDTKGTLTSMSSKAFDGLKNGAVSLGKMLAPVTEDPSRRNDTTVQLLWYPQSREHYRKGNSVATPKDKPKYGEFMVYVEPEKYADIGSYFSSTFGSVEDFFADVLGGCTDSFCLKGKAMREPYKHQAIQIHNYQPEIDEKERAQLEIGL
jgi:hypothetical protein